MNVNVTGTISVTEKSTGPIYHQGSNPTGPIERSVQIPKFYKETNYGTDATLNRRVKIPSDPSSNVTTIDNKCLHIGLRE